MTWIHSTSGYTISPYPGEGNAATQCYIAKGGAM